MFGNTCSRHLRCRGVYTRSGHILLEESYKVFEEFEAVLSQFIAELAAGDDDAPVGVVAYALAVLPEADIDIQTSLVNTEA